MKLFQALSISVLAVGSSYGFSQQSNDVSRREAVSKTLSIVAISLPGVASAIDACPPKSNNCVRQTWTPPSSTSAADATNQLRDAFNAYPQDGQEGGKVDGGGYTIISDTLGKDSSTGALTLEYQSGIGTFAKMFNGKKPFTDDLVVEPNGNAFEIRSASRIGDSDFGVNGKRCAYIGGLLQEKGWSI